jgi:hypothetical protein
LAFDEGPQLERVKRNDNRRWPILAIALGVMLVALAALHPWADDTSTAEPVALASPTASAPPFDPNRLYPQCFPNAGWRLASLQQQQPNFKVRTAWPVSEVPKPSASAATMPTLYGPGVEAIGFCTPGSDPLTRAQYVNDVTLWRRTSSGAVALVPGTHFLDSDLAAQGEVYLTPPASISADGDWPPGDYFFQVRKRGSAPGSNDASSRWLALRLVVENHSSAPARTAAPNSVPSFMHAE